MFSKLKDLHQNRMATVVVSFNMALLVLLACITVILHRFASRYFILSCYLSVELLILLFHPDTGDQTYVEFFSLMLTRVRRKGTFMPL